MDGAELRIASDKSSSLAVHYYVLRATVRLVNAGRKEGYPLLAFSLIGFGYQLSRKVQF